MKQIFSDSPDRFHFSWPEPLIIDLIDTHYSAVQDTSERMALARLQSKILHDLFEGAHRESLAMRAELVAYCQSRGIGDDVIAGADRAIFHELTQLIESKFRMSVRLRRELGTKLHTAFSLLLAPSEPVRTPVRTAPRRPSPTFAHALA